MTEHTYLTMSREEASELIRKQIKKINEFANINIRNEKDLQDALNKSEQWIQYNIKLLEKIYTTKEYANRYRNFEYEGPIIGYGPDTQLPSFNDQVNKFIDNMHSSKNELESYINELELHQTSKNVKEKTSELDDLIPDGIAKDTHKWLQFIRRKPLYATLIIFIIVSIAIVSVLYTKTDYLNPLKKYVLITLIKQEADEKEKNISKNLYFAGIFYQSYYTDLINNENPKSSISRQELISNLEALNIKYDEKLLTRENLGDLRSKITGYISTHYSEKESLFYVGSALQIVYENGTPFYVKEFIKNWKNMKNMLPMSHRI